MKILSIPKSLEEVWEWKKKCHEESKGLSIRDYLNTVHANADKVLKEAGFIEKNGKLKRNKN